MSVSVNLPKVQREGGREGEEMEKGDKDRGEVIHCSQRKQHSQTSECHPHTGVCVCVCVCAPGGLLGDRGSGWRE